MSGGFGSLIRKGSAKFQKKHLKILEIEHVSWVKVSFFSITLKLEITVLFGIPRNLRDSHNSLGLPIVSERFSSKKACFQSVLRFRF